MQRLRRLPSSGGGTVILVVERSPPRTALPCHTHPARQPALQHLLPAAQVQAERDTGGGRGGMEGVITQLLCSGRVTNDHAPLSRRRTVPENHSHF